MDHSRLYPCFHGLSIAYSDKNENSQFLLRTSGGEFVDDVDNVDKKLTITIYIFKICRKNADFVTKLCKSYYPQKIPQAKSKNM